MKKNKKEATVDLTNLNKKQKQIKVKEKTNMKTMLKFISNLFDGLKPSKSKVMKKKLKSKYKNKKSKA